MREFNAERLGVRPVEERYNPQAIEPKWQKTWLDAGADRTSEDGGGIYCLVEKQQKENGF